MLSATEIARGAQSAVRVLQLDPGAPFQFENTAEACLRSFRVIFLVSPLYLLYVLLRYSRVHTVADEWEILLIESMTYVVDWLLFPVLFYEIARRRNWLDRYSRYIQTLNWINLPAITVAVMGMAVSAVAPSAFGTYLLIGVQCLLFYWFMAATRLALGIGWGMASVLLVVNWMPTLMLSFLVDRILGVSALVP
jgi:hypothetical protein